MLAVHVTAHGGPEVLKAVELEPPTPGPGQVLVVSAALGVNFADIHQRRGAGKYAQPPPFVPGTEGAGTVSAVGDDVDGITVGDRVAWKVAPASYAQQVVVSAGEVLPLPDEVSFETAAAVMVQGLTAQYLVTDTYPVQPGDTVLIHAAAGGVGSMLTQMATLKGARVIATVSSAEKEALARESGAAEVIRYDQAEVSAAVRELTGGDGVAAVFDGVGADTIDASLASLRPRGHMVVYGYSSGPIPAFDVQRLNSGGSLYITRPSLVHYSRTREELLGRAHDLLGWLASGQLTVRIGGRFNLADAAAAHEAMQSRRTTGKLLLLPA
jgi:NADPH2:quinone reductase